MDINLDGLTPVADIAICVASNAYKIDITPNDWECPAVEAIKALQGINGVYVSALKSVGWITVFPGNYDIRALAERIATECEMQGLKVRRLISDPKDRNDLSPKIPTQSFLF